MNFGTGILRVEEFHKQLLLELDINQDSVCLIFFPSITDITALGVVSCSTYIFTFHVCMGMNPYLQ